MAFDSCGTALFMWQPIPIDPSLIDGYVILRNGDSIAVITDTADTYVDSTVSPGSTYTYEIWAYTSCGYSPGSCAASITMPSGPPEVQNLAASDTLCRAVEVTWDSVSGDFDGYFLYRDGQLIDSIARGSPTVYRDSLADTLATHTYTMLTVFESSCNTNPVECDDDGGEDLDSVAEVDVTQGTTYYIVVDGYSEGEDGGFELSVEYE